jgi:hypothetical protein
VELDASATLADVLERARDAYAELLAVGEGIEDEWSETNELASAWQARFDEVAASRGPEPVAPRLLSAVDALIDEAMSIEDPHRAIDWLSTFPQVLLVAIGERP